jgi:hypothetical protein
VPIVVQGMWGIGLGELGVGHWSYCEGGLGGENIEDLYPILFDCWCGFWVVWALLRQGLGCIIMLVACLLDGPKSRGHIAFFIQMIN